MTAFDRLKAFILEDLRVLSVEAKSGGVSGEGHVNWSASFYDADPVLESAGSTRVLIASLHAASGEGWGTVTVGGLITPIDENMKVDGEDLISTIAASAALETLYDFARVNLRTVAGMADIHLELPYQSPDADVSYEEAESDEADEAIKSPRPELTEGS